MLNSNRNPFGQIVDKSKTDENNEIAIEIEDLVMEEENLVNNTFENSALDIENILVNDLEVSNLVTTDNHL